MKAKLKKKPVPPATFMYAMRVEDPPLSKYSVTSNSSNPRHKKYRLKPRSPGVIMLLKFLHAHPGVWCRIGTGTRSQASSLRGNLRNSYPEVESTVRVRSYRSTLYARYIPPATQSPDPTT